jgi:AcrR family transcriptional regulator
VYSLSISRSSPSRTAPRKRPYLQAADRRRQLLDATGRLFERVGFSGITMSGVASEAGVSRQLVYDHFADLDSLYLAFVEDRLAHYRTDRPDIAGMGTGAATAAVFEHLLTISSADRRIIRLLAADVGVHALDRVRRRFRDEELSRWPALASRTKSARVASALVWTATSALLALADAVAAGDLGADDATGTAVALVGALMDA